VLSEVETDVDATRRGHLKTKLTSVLASKLAHAVQFIPSSGSPVPNEIRELTKSRASSKDFVIRSQSLAQYLFQQQTGAVSPGLLCVIDVAASHHDGLVLMKLEREAGAQLQLTNKSGKRTFSMEVLDDLVLTEGTRLFKTAMFLRTGKGDHDFRSSVGDSQLNAQTSDQFAKFWMRFLGCMFVVEPKVATQRFYATAVDFVNTTVTDSVVKAVINDSLHSELLSNIKVFSPRQFIENYVPADYQNSFVEHFKERKISLAAFPKDLSDIAGRLRRRAYQTSKGAMISVPEEEAGLVVVNPENVVINDTVVNVK